MLLPSPAASPVEMIPSQHSLQKEFSMCCPTSEKASGPPPPYAVSLMYGWSNECACGHWLCEPLRAAACEAVRVRSMSKMQRHGPSR